MKACPKCNSELRVKFTCHTYWQFETWKACMNCDSALKYYCLNEECDWHYTHGLNQMNPRALLNETKKPKWLGEPESDEIGSILKHPEVKWDWEDELNQREEW